MAEEKNPTDSLIEEILDNVRQDREMLITVRNKIVEATQIAEVQAEPLTMIGIGENIAKLSEQLTRMNAQLVELVKVEVKRSRPSENDTHDDIFDDIESAGHDDPQPQ